jgi:tetratricopeptide (TPR) repeat protein
MLIMKRNYVLFCVVLLSSFLLVSCNGKRDKETISKTDTITPLKDDGRTSLEKLGITREMVKDSTEDPKSQALILKAISILEDGINDEAIKLLDEYTWNQPQKYSGWFILGYALSEKGDYSAALPKLEQALKLRPRDTYALMYSGLCHLKLNDLPMAYADFTNVIRQDDRFALAYYNRGQVLAYMQKFKEALADYDMAVALMPEYAPAYNNRGNVKFLMKDTTAACEDWKKSIEMGNTGSVKAYNMFCKKKQN